MKKSKIDLEKYEAIIFDFGGVIININYQLSVDAFEKLGFKNFNNWYAQAAQHNLFDKLETGQMSEMDFCNEVRKISNLVLTNNQIINAWNALLLNLPMQRVTMLESIKNTHQIFLLSNTNQIHASCFSANIDEGYGWQKFKSLFVDVYLSHEIKMRKPNVDAFEYVINKNNLNRSTTLFIDDSIQHIDGAKYVGLQTYFLNTKNNETILDLF